MLKAVILAVNDSLPRHRRYARRARQHAVPTAHDHYRGSVLAVLADRDDEQVDR